MGRWVYKEVKKEPLKNYFRSYFFAGLIFNFIGLLSAMSVKYYDEEITKAKWLGAISGFGFSAGGFLFIIVFSGTNTVLNRVGAVIAVIIWLIGVVFGIVYNYKYKQP